MQYLSRAYNYYSGINPATLSGAIDIIVVKTQDEETGEELLNCSPFHVRFGKLQVLRAGEKRVTLRLPNNLPPPHVAPFSMKVGETGEAFFVLETEEEVPAELMTSPVVMATDAEGEHLGHTPKVEPTEIAASSITKQPFGATEQQVSHEGHTADKLEEVEPLDLNDSMELSRDSTRDGDDRDSATSESGHTVSELSGAPKGSGAKGRRRRHSSTVSKEQQPPNPLEARPGEDTTLPIRDYRLNMMHSDYQDVKLPKVSPGEHDGPDVKYKKDIVLDMDGFHGEKEKMSNKKKTTSSASEDGAEGAAGEKGHASDDDVAAQPSPEEPMVRPSSPIVPNSPPWRPQPDSVTNEQVEELVDDLMANDSGSLPASMAALSLEGERPRSPPLHLSPDSPARSRFDRGASEPPDVQRPTSPTGGASSNTQMDYAWDWGRIPENEEASLPASARAQPHRSATLPAGDSAGLVPRAQLHAVDDDPWTFALALDGREHLFELSLCGDDAFAPRGDVTDDELHAFVDARVSFERFMADPAVADDPRLAVFFGGQYYTWKTAYHLLFALSIYRRSLKAPARKPADAGAEPKRAGYGWSRWWRRAEEPAKPEIARTQSAQAALEEAKRVEGEGEPRESDAGARREREFDSAPVSPGAGPVAGPDEGAAAAEGSDAGKHYAKTLRLSSDQLKQLNLKPGPNTIQFSVTSSYSGFAVVSARIFLWDDTDQIVISDIDGTITKSDALGHVFAAIGRDWTHIGIANLYTDICNNGYKIIYLTARAIGQADSTREYLKTIVQGEYRMPEGPVIMSPDRLMASLHREVILRKPELFKMACLRDIQRLFGPHAKDAFFAGFGNRITDAMSYRSVGIGSGKIYTIDSTGIIKTELLQSAHKGSYVGLNDLVNEVFPPVKTKAKPEFTDFNYWRDPLPDIQLPDLSPPSPALSARSDGSVRSGTSYIGRLVSLGRRGSRADNTTRPSSPTSNPSTRPSSPLIGPAITGGDLSDADERDEGDGEDEDDWRRHIRRPSSPSSMPGSFDDTGAAFPESWLEEHERRTGNGSVSQSITDSAGTEEPENYDDDAIFDDDILATGEMARVPF